jgi:6-phosphogluconolactonase
LKVLRKRCNLFTMENNVTVRIFSNPADLSQFAAGLLKQNMLEAVARRGKCLAALSGGGTPQALYHLMANTSLPWDKMHFFWGDERCVPPDDAESCYQQAYSTWLGKVPLPPVNLHRAKGELGPALAAEDYTRQLKALAEPGRAWPRFDLVLLGLGADGHTASLFPGSVETSSIPMVTATAYYGGRPAERVSMTPDVFNAARTVLFLASGAEKAEALAATLTGQRAPVKFPAQRIQPLNGQLWWLVDTAAASLLPEKIEGVAIQR